MCGLAGFITHKNTKLNKEQQATRKGILKGLIIAMQERGTHSAGIAGAFGDDWKIIKEAKPACELIGTIGFNNLLEDNPHLMIGHTRFATVGEVTEENAHPFNIGNIIGCHNGNVSNHLEIYRQGEVDSEAIFYLLDQKNNDYKKAFKELSGKFAITWFDQNNLNKLFLVRNDNPLYLIKVDELNTYFWASTYYALQSLVGAFYPLAKKTIWELKEDYVYEIDTQFQIKKTKIKFKEKNYSGYFDSNYDDENGLYDTLNDDKKKVKDLVGTNDVFLSNSSYSQLRKICLQVDGDGCAFCSNQINIEQGCYWEEETEAIVCNVCVEELQAYTTTIFLDEDDILDIFATMADYDYDKENKQLKLT